MRCCNRSTRFPDKCSCSARTIYINTRSNKIRLDIICRRISPASIQKQCIRIMIICPHSHRNYSCSRIHKRCFRRWPYKPGIRGKKCRDRQPCMKGLLGITASIYPDPPQTIWRIKKAHHDQFFSRLILYKKIIDIYDPTTKNRTYDFTFIKAGSNLTYKLPTRNLKCHRICIGNRSPDLKCKAVISRNINLHFRISASPFDPASEMMPRNSLISCRNGHSNSGHDTNI